MTNPYKIAPGDTLSVLAQRNNTTVEDLMKLNPDITNRNMIYAGRSLNLPMQSPGAATPPQNGTVPSPSPTPTGAGVSAPAGSPPAGSPPAPGTLVPPGATYIADPSQLAGFTDDQIIKTPEGRIYAKPGLSPTPIKDKKDLSLLEAIGNAGLGLSDVQSIINIQTSPSQGEIDSVRTGLGIPALEESAFAKPSKGTETLYNEAYAQAGIVDIKKQFDALTRQINDKKDALLKEVGGVNENPWLTEVSRVGRLKALIEVANSDIGNVVEQQKQVGDLYSRAINEVNGFVTRNTQDFNQDQARNQAKLNYLLKIAEQQLTSKIEEKKKGYFRYLPDYLKKYGAAKESGRDQQVIGGQEVGFWRWNPATGKFEMVIAPKKSTGSGSSKTDRQLTTEEKQAIKEKLASATGEDGYVNPLVYREVISMVGVELGDGAIKDFQATFPPTQFLSIPNRVNFGGAPGVGSVDSIVEEKSGSAKVTD